MKQKYAVMGWCFFLQKDENIEKFRPKQYATKVLEQFLSSLVIVLLYQPVPSIDHGQAFN